MKIYQWSIPGALHSSRSAWDKSYRCRDCVSHQKGPGLCRSPSRPCFCPQSPVPSNRCQQLPWKDQPCRSLKLSSLSKPEKDWECGDTEIEGDLQKEDRSRKWIWKALLCLYSWDGGSVKIMEYWVQIFCFPTCTCDNFWKHHWYKQSFLLCKHLYWVFKHIFHLEIWTNLLIIQPVWTVGELKDVLARETDLAWS
jgi:hypothetical protein